MRRVALFLLLSGLFASGLGWNNNYDEPLDFKCPAGYSISSIRSQNNNYYQDRQWEFGCKSTYTQSAECLLSNYVNAFDKPFTFECPSQYVIAGVSSYHSNLYEDRRWQFYCCKTKCVTGAIGNCQWTPYVNDFNKDFQWTLPPQSLLVGADSYHKNWQQDRRWKYKYCVQQCS